MSEDPNIHAPVWEGELPAPFRLRGQRVGAAAGARELGVALYELEPGGAVSPYHVHHANEELLIVLAGSPELRTPAGTRRLQAGAVVAFPRGAEGAHRVSNPGPEIARVLLVSTMNTPDVAEHLDTGALLAILGQAEGKVFPAGADISVPEALARAMAAADEQAP
jgi:uncharacterized cupin superfamily protein